ncbi:glycosyltransferase family 9 protein [Jejudonia soesokkakensis]|uniref:Glycosyltransferase family 9 protein n=1 Tax=Jejudonia soesokkakensis TaxID=1323432 RepID=A0ABW2MMJ5_9FLAO
MQKPKHILIIRLSALGDVAMTVPVLRVLKHTYPELKLTVVSRPFFKPLFDDIPDIQFIEANVTEEHKNLGLFKLAETAKKQGIDAVADLHNVIRSKAIRNYLLFKNSVLTSKIDKGRTEKKRLTVSSKSKKIVALKSTHQRYADVFDKLGYPIDLKDHVIPKQQELTPELHELIGKHTKKLIGIAPFAAHKGKMYPLEFMAEVISKLNETENYKVFLFGGGASEISALTTIAKANPGVVNIAGQLKFKEELRLISNLDGMISMDSGNGHLAAMYGIPVLTLWGVTHPYLGFKPFNQPNKNQLISNRDKYPLIPTSVYGNKYPEAYENAMKSIPVALVVDKAIELF